MSDKHTPKDEGSKLPVTAEVGGEGGSYADGAVQAETLQGEVERVEQFAPDPQDRGAVAGAVAPSSDDPEDGVRFPDAKPGRPA